MKRFAKFFRNENGQAAVLAAFMIVVLMGFAALSIDLGRAYLTKSNLQKAADAAALAGAKDLPVKTTAESMAVAYAGNNGVQTTEVAVTTPYNGDKTKIAVVCTRNIEYTFAKVLGITNVDISSLAVAQVTNAIGQASGYTVFSEDELKWNGGNHVITGGDVYGGGGIKFNGNGNQITGVFNYATGIVDFRGSIDGGSEKIPPIAMPNIANKLLQYKTITVCANMAQFNAAIASSINGVIKYTGGNLALSGAIHGKGVIWVNNGSITTSSQDQNSNDSICFYSENGDITFNGQLGSIYGVLYAPLGSITVNGSHGTVTGTIIGKNITINGNGFTVISGEDDLGGINMVTGAAKLIK